MLVEQPLVVKMVEHGLWAEETDLSHNRNRLTHADLDFLLRKDLFLQTLDTRRTGNSTRVNLEARLTYMSEELGKLQRIEAPQGPGEAPAA